MTDKKYKSRMFVFGILLSVFFSILMGSAILYVSEMQIRGGVAAMAGAVAEAAPDKLKDIMHLYKTGSFTGRGQEILARYGYAGGGFSFVPVWFWAAAYILPLLTALLLLLAFGLSYRRKRKEAEKNLEALSGYLNGIMEGKYDTLPQKSDSAGSLLEDSIYKAFVLLREEREQADTAKRNLAENLADLSHQLKTPAASLGLTLSLLKRNAKDGREKEDIRQMEGQIGHLQQLVGAMLTMSKLDAGVLELEQREFELEEMLLDAVQPFVRQIEEKEIRFETEGADGILITGDFRWCSEAFGNIIKNCIEHTGKRGNIRITCRDNPIYTGIVIKDSGSGFLEADLPHLFERFYRGVDSPKDSVGIGLALSKSILERENGSVTAGNAKAGGAEFRIKIYHCH